MSLDGASSPVNEGSLYTLTLGDVTGAGSRTIGTYTIHWGDGESRLNMFSTFLVPAK